MSEELREVYIERSLQSAYANGDGMIIEANQNKLRHFLLNTKNQHYAFQKLNKPLLLIIKALCNRYGVEYDIQEQETGEIDLVVFRKHGGGMNVPKMKVVEIIEENIREKMGAGKKSGEGKVEEKRKPVKVLTRNKDKKENEVKKIENVAVPIDESKEASQPTHPKQTKPPNPEPQKPKPKPIHDIQIDTSAFQQDISNAITYNHKHDPDFIRESPVQYPSFFYQYGLMSPFIPQPQTSQPNQPYNPFESYPEQDHKPKRRYKESQFEDKGNEVQNPKQEKFIYKEEDFPSL